MAVWENIQEAVRTLEFAYRDGVGLTAKIVPELLPKRTGVRTAAYAALEAHRTLSPDYPLEPSIVAEPARRLHAKLDSLMQARDADARAPSPLLMVRAYRIALAEVMLEEVKMRGPGLLDSWAAPHL